ncbi:MAG: hypothetical protein Q4D56_12530 [Bacteroides sp.]|nr:hypothetical protein [Bacteroides sp.]
MKVNILLCDTFPGLLPVYIPSYVSMFTRMFDALSDDMEYQVYRAMDGELPDELAKGDEMYLITGCNLSAYDDIDWIKQLLAWVVKANEAQVKLVGICFGHQLIAQALGGRVERATQGWGTGIRELSVVDDEARIYFPEGKMRLLYNHHDQVVALPKDAELVATSDFCPVESFRIGRHILTFQGHPEYIPQYAVHLLENFADDEPLQVRQAALDSIRSMKHQGLQVAQWILEWVNA